MTLPIDLSGKTVLVCGVARGGIGGATCRQLARAGATILALDKDPALIEPTIADVEALGATIQAGILEGGVRPAGLQDRVQRRVEPRRKVGLQRGYRLPARCAGQKIRSVGRFGESDEFGDHIAVLLEARDVFVVVPPGGDRRDRH